MRIRTFVIAIAISVAVLAVALIAASNVLVHRFDAIEAEQTAGKAAQALRALEADLNQLAMSTRDYAEWDDAQHYAINRDPEFLRANFSIDSLDGMEVDVLALLGPDGQLLYGTEVDSSDHRLSASLSPDLLGIVRGLQHEIAPMRRRASAERILRTGKGMLAFCIVEIARSDRSAPTGAAMFFGRYLREDELERMRQTSHLSMSLATIDALDPGALPAAANLQEWLQGKNGSGDTDAAVTDDRHIAGYALVRDVERVPLAIISVVANRDIGDLGRRTTTLLMGTIAGLILICGTVLLLLFARFRREWHRGLSLKDQHRRILTSLDEGIALVDPANGRITEANDALLRCIDYSRDDLPHLQLGHIYVDLVGASDALAKPGGTAVRECRLRARDGRLIETEINGTILQDPVRPMICIVTRDISQRREAEQNLRENQSRLAHLAGHDALTGLPNRAYLQTRLPEILRKVAADEMALALFYLDIDHFKNVNDANGHGLGDQVLKLVAARLSSDGRPEDIVLRMGGDEFVIVAPIASATTIRELSQRLLNSVRAPITIGPLDLSLTASIGVAAYPVDGLDGESLLKHADIALYQAKENGRNRCQAFASDMNVQRSEHLALEQALRRAIDTEQICVHYQPIVDLHTGLVVSFEALARWNHQEWGSIPPGRFIPVAEKSGLIVPLGAQIVREVMLQLRAWELEGLTVAPVAINVAPVQFERTEFSTFVHEAAAEHEIDLGLLAFEVTESAWLQNSNKHVVMIDTLRHAGSRIYIDDFGTGFSNLSYLKTLPIDAVKIDQSFIRGIETDEKDAAIVGGIVTMARQLGLTSVAEGIETAAQAERLRSLGCQYGQGYYFSRPMPATQCRALLEQLGAARKLTETVKIRAFRRAAG